MRAPSLLFRLQVVTFALLSAALMSVQVRAQQCTDPQFVQRAFNDLLFRAPDQAALAYYTPLASSAGHEAVAESIIASAEYSYDLVGGNPAVVAGFYQKFLGRNPTASDAQSWVLQEPTNDATIIEGIMATAEYRNRALTLNPGICDENQRLVNQMYLDLLGRNADASALQTYGQALATGWLTVQQIAGQIVAGNEYLTDVITRSYVRFLHRPPDQTAVNYFLPFLQNDARPEEDMQAILVGSLEYCNTTQQPTPTYALVTAAQTLAALNNFTVPSNIDQLPAVQANPFEAATESAILTLQTQVNTDTSQISSLESQVTRLNVEIATLDNTVMEQAATASATANTLLGAPPTKLVAEAIAAIAQARVNQAIQDLGANVPLVQQAQGMVVQGNVATQNGEFAKALNYYRVAVTMVNTASK